MEEASVNGPLPPKDQAVIQLLHEEELEQVVSLEKSCFSSPWSRDSILNALREPNGLSLGCRLYGELIGYIISFMVLNEAYITNFLVAPMHRRKGHGTALLRYYMKEVREKEGDHIFLEVREGNEAALTLYKKMEFQRVCVRKKYYADTKEDALVMKISFNEH